jgi:hypothetical protein
MLRSSQFHRDRRRDTAAPEGLGYLSQAYVLSYEFRVARAEGGRSWERACNSIPRLARCRARRVSG